MRGRFLLGRHKAVVEGNVYADKSSLVLDWLLRVGVHRESFSLREVTRDRPVSVGLVQRVFGVLVLHGLLKATGIRTAKRFSIPQPEILLASWLEHYSIVKRCKMWTYRTTYQNKQELLNKLHESDYASKAALALHSAAEAYGYKNTNLDTVELYMLDPSVRAKLEDTLELDPQERGYEVLLIEPYYKSLLKLETDAQNMTKRSPLLLTFLDLYHFPLRGHEQAEFIAERAAELKQLYNPTC